MEEFDKILSKISYENGLSKEECSFSFNYILEGKASDHQIELFLLGLRERGETVEEITIAAKIMREKSKRVLAPEGAIDTCGTGGDGSGTYKIFNQELFYYFTQNYIILIMVFFCNLIPLA